MAYNFPDAPTAGQEFDTGDAVYIFQNGAWDLKSGAITDYVLKAGDTMTGDLTLSGSAKLVAGGQVNINGTNKRVLQFNKCWFQQRQGSHSEEGFLEFWTDNGGWSSVKCFENILGSGGGGLSVEMAGITNKGGIRFGSRVSASPTDLSGHITLYGTHFGFSVTSSTLNYVSSLNHNFYSGTALVYTIDNVGSIGNSVNVTAPEALAIAEELGVVCDSKRGVDVMKVVAALLAKIKALEER
jgi:hypothetical protein